MVDACRRTPSHVTTATTIDAALSQLETAERTRSWFWQVDALVNRLESAQTLRPTLVRSANPTFALSLRPAYGPALIANAPVARNRRLHGTATCGVLLRTVCLVVPVECVARIGALNSCLCPLK